MNINANLILPEPLAQSEIEQSCRIYSSTRSTKEMGLQQGLYKEKKRDFLGSRKSHKVDTV